MELRQLQTFIAITRTGSFSKAAQSLGYSQSAVTVQIRLLEQELNARLFDRMGKSVALTSQGREFERYAADIILEVNRAKNFNRKRDELSSPLSIGTLESLCFSKLPPILKHFRQKHPKVSIRIITGSPKELIGQMEANRLDLIYILDRQRYNENWNKVMEVEEPIVFVSSASSPLAGKKGVEAEELLDHPFFLTEKDENYRRELDSFLETKRRMLTAALEISNTEFIIRMVRENRGISYLPLFAVRERVEQGELAILDVPELKRTLYRQIFYHRNKWLSPEMEEFIRAAENLSGIRRSSMSADADPNPATRPARES